MFADICFMVKGNTIEVNGQEFRLGELAVKCLNISPEVFEGLYKQSKAIEEYLNEDVPDEETWYALNDKLFSFFSALRQIPLLAMLEDSSVNQYLTEFTYPDEDKEEAWEFYLQIVVCCLMIVDDVYAFNNTIHFFVINYLMKLSKLDSENYATAYYDFLTNPFADKIIVNPIYHSGVGYMNTEFLTMNLMPVKISDDSDTYMIAEYYHTGRLQSLLRIDMLKGMMVGHHIRQCEYCSRFFLLTKGYKTKYCDNPAPDHPNFTCSQMAYHKTRKKENNTDNPKYQAYQRCIKRIMRSYQRGRISQSERLALIQKADALYHEAATSPKFGNEEFEQILQADSLYKFCGITPPKKGRPKNDK